MKFRMLELILAGLACATIGCNGDGLPADVEPIVPTRTKKLVGAEVEPDVSSEERPSNN